MADVPAERVIDLDLIGVEPEAGRRGPAAARRSSTAVSVMLTVLVVAVLTGPSVPASLTLAWRAAISTPFVWLSSDALYTVDVAGGVASLESREPGSGRMRWRVPLSGTLASAYATRDAELVTRFPPRLGDAIRTEIDWHGQTGVAFPVYAMPLAYIAGAVAIVIDRNAEEPASGIDVDAAGLVWSYHVTAIDLRTGALRWTRRIPAGVRWSLPGVRPGSTGIAALPPGVDWMVTYSDRGSVQIWNLASGTLRAYRAIGRLEPEAYVMALGDAVLVHHRDTAAGPRVQLLDPVTLVQRQQFVPVLPEAEPLSCAPDICLNANGGAAVIDPATGVVLARVTGTELRPGPAGKLLATGYGRPLSIMDLRSGETSTINDWLLVDPGAYVSQLVVASGVDPKGRGRLGLLNLVTGELTRFGPAGGWTLGGQCQASLAVVACTNGSILTVWRR